jgi:flagellar biosynthesis/type III secretory pathway protein FliH
LIWSAVFPRNCSAEVRIDLSSPPTFTWKTVRVNPEDVALAREQFPGAEVLADPGVIGGLEAASDRLNA